MTSTTSSRKWKYVGPHDAVEIAGVGVVAAGDEFESELDFTDRPDFQPLDPHADPGGDNADSTGPNEDRGHTGTSKLSVAQLRDALDELGIDHKGLKKPELVDALTTATATASATGAAHTPEEG